MIKSFPYFHPFFKCVNCILENLLFSLWLINLYGTRSLLQKLLHAFLVILWHLPFQLTIPHHFFYPFKYCRRLQCCVPSLCVLIFALWSYFCRDFKNGIWRTTKVKFSRVLAFIDEGRPEILVERTRSFSPSSSHIFQNRLRWTRTEKKQTSNWIKTTVSL